MKKLNNILLVSGSGRNCGKTTLACQLIKQLSKTKQVFGLKITPHFHLAGSKQVLIFEGTDFKIFKEMNAKSGKDSARMLGAGAKAVYFIQSKDEGLSKLHHHLKSLVPEHCPIVCESGSLANVYKPGFHILVEGSQCELTKTSYLINLKKADIILPHDKISQMCVDYNHEVTRNNWKLNKVNHDQVRRSA